MEPPRKKKRVCETTWDDLPTEIVNGVLAFMDDFELVAARRVCRLWSALAARLWRDPARLAPTRSEYVVEMARRGDLDAVQWAWPVSVGFGSRLAAAAFVDDRNHDDDGVHREGSIDAYRAVGAASSSGNVALAHWLCVDRRCHWTDGTSRAAARDGRLNVIQWMHREGYTRQPFYDGSNVTSELAAAGHLDALRWLYDQGDALWSPKTCARAAHAGRLDVLRWLRERDCPWDARTCVAAADAGRPEILWWAIAHGCDHADAGIAAGLARNGLFDDLVRAADSGCPLSKSTSIAAAYAGRVDILEWLQIKRCPITDEALDAAGCNDHVDVMRWLRDQGLPWPPWARHTAARGGYLDTLKWIVAEGCLCDVGVMGTAVSQGHLHVVEWLCDAVGIELTEDMFGVALGAGRSDVLPWLRERGCPLGDRALPAMARHGHLDALCWAVRVGYPFDPQECRDAVSGHDRRHRAVKRWLDAQIALSTQSRCDVSPPDRT